MSLFIRKQLGQPERIFLICLGLLIIHFIKDGVLFRLWELQRDQTKWIYEIDQMKGDILSLEKNLIESRSLSFIEKSARERLDLVRENDLVFVFPKE